MTNELAIRILTGDVLGTASQTSEAIKTAVKALSMPPAEPELAQNLHNACIDAISRQAAIELIENESRKWGDEYGVSDVLCDLADLPAAQPEERTNKSTKTHACDLIDRRALMKEFSDFVRASNNSDFAPKPTWNDAVSLVKSMPLVQPSSSCAHENVQDLQPTCNKLATDCISRQQAIDALDTAIEHYDGIAEECRKKADIERNDYMDMRDDAYEARQLAQWLNELKYLREKIEQLTIQPEERTVKRMETHGVCLDAISRQAAIREYQEVCKGIKCGECPFLIKVNTEKGSHLITDCKLEAFLHDLPSAQPDLSSYSDKLWRNAYDRGRKEAMEEIIRCGECKYMMEDGRCYEFADDNIRPSASDFCSYAERRKDGR